MIGRTYQQTMRPAPLPVSLESGKLDPRVTLIFVGAGTGILLLSLIFAFISSFAFPEYQYQVISRGRSLLAYGSGFMGLLLFGIGVHIVLLPIRRERQHNRRVQAWNEQALIERQEQGGIEISQEVSEWELLPTAPGHVLLAAIACHLQQGASARIAHSTRAMEDGLYIGDKRHLVKVGEVSPANAEVMSRRFAEIGLVQGRDGARRSAGEWTAASLDDIVRIVAENWSRVGGEE